ncbi:hypothetical protein NA57DRAFT_55479 [Rhizodiscina lignyota]|uniref:Uncharacterized protein n=1 Tax=Rhizodiscina lignyota TaxID=1504668 RepID=A0A9P4IDD0_9PEZI|nr:hypothetical protein NA57DRAFT_55479 [Rhizodiscina lignyota]
MDTPKYRPAKVVGFTLRDTSTVLLDDELYPQAISFLSSLLHSGGSQNRQWSTEAYTPCARQLVLLSTIVVHPLFTNRASNAERSEASNSTLHLLYDITKVVGPVNAGFAAAFDFSSHRALRTHTRKRAAPLDSDSDDSDELRDRNLESKYARSESVWMQADDLWHIVGWSFNCSIKYKKRWERWALWLEFIVSAIEADWKERVHHAKETVEFGPSAARGLLRGSMIFQYVGGNEGRNRQRRIMRAILADGQQKSLNEFPEIWNNETKERKSKKDQLDKPSKKINLDEGEFGDYDIDDDEDELMEDGDEDGEGDVTITPDSEDSESKKIRAEAPDPFQLGTAKLGGVTAVSLRLRLLALLLKLSCDLPRDFTNNAEEFLDLYTEFLRPLPLPHFCALSTNPYIDAANHVCLLVNHLIPLTAVSPPKDLFNITQQDLVRDFIPRAANAYSNVDNAKVSVVLECLFVSMLDHFGIEPTEEFGSAVEEGIRARKARAIGDARKKDKGTSGDEKNARKELDFSSERLMTLLEMIEEG